MSGVELTNRQLCHAYETMIQQSGAVTMMLRKRLARLQELGETPVAADINDQVCQMACDQLAIAQITKVLACGGEA